MTVQTVRDATFDVFREYGLTSIFANPGSTEISLLADLPHYLRGASLTFWVFHVLRDYAATLREGASPHLSALTGLLAEAKELEAAVGLPLFETRALLKAAGIGS